MKKAKLNTQERKMPLTEKGRKIMNNMQRTYGGKKGEQVFYATRNAGKITGVEETSARKSTGARVELMKLATILSPE